MSARSLLAAGALLFLAVGPAQAQTQIRPRVLLMVDTSGSMTEQIDDTSKDTGGDGSNSYTDSLNVTRDPSTPGFQYGVGFSQPANQCAPANNPTDFRGRLSKMFAAKSAVNNVLNGSGEIDWGLERYSGTYCPLLATSGALGPNLGCGRDSTCDNPNFPGRGNCTGGACVCGDERDCPPAFHCTGARCRRQGLMPRFCNNNNQCQSNSCLAGPPRACTCTNDGQCNTDEFCISSMCQRDNNQCLDRMFSASDTRNDGMCKDRLPGFGNPGYSLSGTYGGSCGTQATCKFAEFCDNSGNNDCSGSGACDFTVNACSCSSNANCGGGGVCNLGYCVSTDAACTRCQTLLTCATAGDCMGGACNPIAGRAANACGCNGNAQCPASQGYTCVGNVCTYSRGCINTGGVIIVDPKVAGSNGKIPIWVDGKEDYSGATGAFETITNGISSNVAVKNPELRPKGNTPLAGAARSAADWYGAIRDYTANTGANPNCLIGTQNDPSAFCDPKIKCRPYVLVQLTDGVDTCDGGGVNGASGPVAAARDFVNATIAGARVLNKVYVIGLSVTSLGDKAELNAIAAGGGSGGARFANTPVEIEAALSDIVTSSVLVERCNNDDDDCNGECDEPFPDVAVTGANCKTKRAAQTCTNGELAGTHCHADGVFQCSSDGLSEVCSAPTCASDPTLCPSAESAGGCNGLDDDCNGVIDDCTPFVAGSCCATVMCPACNPTGVPQTETCNGCDDDCDGIIDNHLMDPAVGVVGGPPCVPLVAGHDKMPCVPGVTACVGGQVVCTGEVLPMPNQCDGISRDCTGVPNTNGNCPTGFMCFQGNCVTPCTDTEFPCPGGYVCKEPEHLCVPDACVKLNCPVGTLCKVADDGTAMCTDPCDMVTCQSGFICQNGVCNEASCRAQGCPAGQICLGSPPTCVTDPCAGVSCPSGQFCDGAGHCVKTCTTQCPASQVCVNGQCQSDPCASKVCSAGQVCAVVGGSGACVEDLCGAGCAAGSVCCGGQCRGDPCAALSCGGSSRCVMDHACNAGCQKQGPDDLIVGAGGGGFACGVGGGGAEGPLVVALIALWLWAVRRRRAESI